MFGPSKVYICVQIKSNDHGYCLFLLITINAIPVTNRMTIPTVFFNFFINTWVVLNLTFYWFYSWQDTTRGYHCIQFRPFTITKQKIFVYYKSSIVVLFLRLCSITVDDSPQQVHRLSIFNRTSICGIHFSLYKFLSNWNLSRAIHKHI
jgi:hypothetical protein